MAALATVGYEVDAEHRLRARLVGSRALVAECNDIALRHCRTGIVVELHWRSNHFVAWADWLALGQTKSHVLSNGQELRVLSDGANLIYLSTHGAMHLWGRLKWLADVARLARRRGASDVSSDLQCARELRANVPLEQALSPAIRLGWLDESYAPTPRHRTGTSGHLAKTLSTIADPQHAPGTYRYRIGFYLRAWTLAHDTSQRIGVVRYGTWRRVRMLIAVLFRRLSR